MTYYQMLKMLRQRQLLISCQRNKKFINTLTNGLEEKASKTKRKNLIGRFHSNIQKI